MLSVWLSNPKKAGGRHLFFRPLPKVPVNFGFAHMGKNGQKWAKVGKYRQNEIFSVKCRFSTLKLDFYSLKSERTAQISLKLGQNGLWCIIRSVKLEVKNFWAKMGKKT